MISIILSDKSGSDITSNSVVVSVAAIIILSVIGGLFKVR